MVARTGNRTFVLRFGLHRGPIRTAPELSPSAVVAARPLSTLDFPIGEDITLEAAA